MDLNKFTQNGVYTLTSCYGDSHSYLFKDGVFTAFINKQQLNEEYVDREVNRGMVSVTFVDTLENFLNNN